MKPPQKYRSEVKLHCLLLRVTAFRTAVGVVFTACLGGILEAKVVKGGVLAPPQVRAARAPRGKYESSCSEAVRETCA